MRGRLGRIGAGMGARVPPAEARNAAILEAGSASIRELQAAMSEWLQAVASSTARLVQSEVSAAGAAGAALDDANATEARGFAQATDEEEREQRLLARVKAEDANAARARAEEETRLSTALRAMEARIDARNSADGKELARMGQVRNFLYARGRRRRRGYLFCWLHL
jgi:hypothetical protein